MTNSNSFLDNAPEEFLERSKKGKWYVVHTYSGHEGKVKINIEKMVANRGYVDDIFEVRVPLEEYISEVGGTKKVKERKIFPGYVFVNMIITDVSWYLVRNTRGVTGFVGPESKPVAVSESEMENFGADKKAAKKSFDIEVGDNVNIVSGAFSDQVGLVQEINEAKETCKVMISLFGRDTSVEIAFDDVEKI
ncbi:MAG: transcription termination/antitermination protein NusG [Finegoldia sp.]|nr:transcription termination/antitermination protein NusG [Finegoldia sp.]